MKHYNQNGHLTTWKSADRLWLAKWQSKLRRPHGSRSSSAHLPLLLPHRNTSGFQQQNQILKQVETVESNFIPISFASKLLTDMLQKGTERTWTNRKPLEEAV